MKRPRVEEVLLVDENEQDVVSVGGPVRGDRRLPRSLGEGGRRLRQQVGAEGGGAACHDGAARRMRDPIGAGGHSRFSPVVLRAQTRDAVSSA